VARLMRDWLVGGGFALLVVTAIVLLWRSP
jgi:hypothetical protein